MEETKEAKKFFSGLGGRYLIGAVVINVLQSLAVLALSHLAPALSANANVKLVLGAVTTDFIGLPLIALLVRRLPAENIERRKMNPGHFVLALMMCYAVGIASNVVGTVITLIIGLVKGGMVQNEILNMTNGASMLLMFLYMVICAPIMEELVFRKLIVDRAVHYGQGVAVIVSGLMFGLFHGNLNQFIYAFTLGMFLAFLYVKTGNLKITISIHMIFNFISSILILGMIRQLDLQEYLRVYAGGNMDEIENYLMEHITALLSIIGLEFIIGCVVIAGIVLLIVALATKKFTFNQGTVTIPKGKRFSAVILNMGMICFCLFWIVAIVRQLFV
ncbi:MAG: CPBP family intramembrane metalloprotease [Acetatifactor sp.]|nr:CPBP family intramembrane metalloprotease [Acetatifactor sp.]